MRIARGGGGGGGGIKAMIHVMDQLSVVLRDSVVGFA
jgi:hypothetical protein